MNKPVYRHEEKFLISPQEYLYLKKLLGSILKQDQNTGESGAYYIRSLYFDTLSNQNFHQKEDGVEERKKIRMRIYSEDSERVKLEIKNKTGAGIYKESAEITRADAEALIKGDIDVLLRYKNLTAGKVYRLFKTQRYRPAVVIDYDREAFIVPVFNGRITFDKNLRACSGIRGLSSGQREMASLFREPKVILEVKYNHMMPVYIRKLLGSGACVPMAISKYCLCRKLIG